MSAAAGTANTDMRPTGAGVDAATLPRLLAGVRERGALSLEQHVAVHGPMTRVRGGGRRHDREHAATMIEEIERSGLLGRGGAGFPTASKMRAVAAARGRAIVVANAAEGEPASLKDRTLIEKLPHLVLDGALVAAEAVGADELIVCVCDTAHESMDGIGRAIEERHRGASAAPSPRIHLTAVPDHYVAGQESALVNHLNGGPAKPVFTPPMVFEQGVRQRPTLVNNVETLAHLALIARHGASWYRQLGTTSQPGSTLVTLGGPVAHPGVYEIEHGASLASLIEAAGGLTARARGALLGGYAGTWIAAEQLRGVALSKEHLAPHRAALGAGVVLLLSQDACPVAETARVARWLADQSTRQCGPCVHGLDAMAETLEEIAAGLAQANAPRRLDRLASLVARRGACGHPDGTVNLILSSLEAFPAEFTDHARHGPCEGCARPPELPLPPGAVPVPVRDETRRQAGSPR
jgi:NADH:ubiquinone oxidoreductase subunit F (NADH-binding)